MMVKVQGYGQAATGAKSGLVAMCISIRSIWPLSLLLFVIMVSLFWSNLCRATFVSSEILALHSGTCLWTWMSLGINTGDLVVDHEYSEFYMWWWAVVQLCPTSTNGIGVDIMCYLINGWGCTKLSP